MIDLVDVNNETFTLMLQKMKNVLQYPKTRM